MKTVKLIRIISIVCCMFVTVPGFAQDKKKKETIKFYVEGMSCVNCQAKIEKNIAWEKGVTDMKCNLKDKTVEVTYNTDKTNTEKLTTAFEKIGMPAKEVKKEKQTENPIDKK